MLHPSRRFLRASCALLVAGSAATVALVAAAPARADGPGYGGAADTLTVEWESGERDGPKQGDQTAASGFGAGGRGVAAAGPVAEAPTVTSNGLTLVVDGVGFRGRSEVEVRVGSAEPFRTRVDQTGTLDVGVPVATAEAARMGTSVVAIGRSPSGTSMTLVGAIPPRPAGVGPVDLVPWVTGAVAVGLAGSWLVTRMRSRPDGGSR